MREIWRALRQAPFFSPLGFLDRALALGGLFLVCHLAGMRQYTCFISGTAPGGDPGDMVTNLMGVGYFILYTFFVLVVPVFAIGAAIFWLLTRTSLSDSPPQPAAASGSPTPCSEPPTPPAAKPETTASPPRT